MAACRTCGAPVLWVMLKPSGKRMPLDLQPTADGNVALAPDEVAADNSPIAHVLGKADREKAGVDGHPLRTSHFATCPQAAQHRKR